MTNRAIAERSGVSRNGVKFHIANVLGKLGLPDRKALRLWFQAPKGSALEQKGARTPRTGNAGAMPRIDGEQAKPAQKGAGTPRTGNAGAVPRIDGEQAKPAQKGAGTPRTGNAGAVPRIDGEQAKPAQKEKTVASPGLGPIAQISRTVSDIQKAERWYSQVLGLPHLYTFGNLAFFDCGGTRLFLSQETTTPSSESIIYFRVDDIEAAHQTLAVKGVEFTNAPHMIHRHADGTEEWMAVFKDLEGRPLAIMAQVKR
jgi:catechol 2,3-dioxygenase-like lactoylglutathione lyase family enzyme